MAPDDIGELQRALRLRFRNEDLLRKALTHRSAAEHSLSSNERLEFLGDAVVGLVVGESLLHLFPAYSEGDLAKSKAYIVSRAALATAAQALELDRYLILSPAEEASGGKGRLSILADSFEALVAAVYLDRGIRVARRLVRDSLMFAIREVAGDRHRRDYKSSLQELIQARSQPAPIYHISEEMGEAHDRTFTAHAIAGEAVIGEGRGKSKKEAEQAAARSALDQLAAAEPAAEAG